MMLQTPPPIAYTGYLMAEKMVFFIGFFGTLAFLVWLLARHYRTRAEVLRLHLASRDRLVAQAGSLEALLAFARTPEGRSLLEPPSLSSSRVPLGLRLIQAGVVCLSVAVLRAGVAILWLPSLQGAGQGQNLLEGLTQTALFAGAGMGLLLAGWLSRRLQAKWLREEDPS